MKPLPWHRGELESVLRDRSRLPHALLVHGPVGIGKTEFAHALAASVLCEDPRGALACEACASCHWFSQANHPDYREIVPESALEDEEGPEGEGAKADKAKSLVIKVEQIRPLADFVALTTHRAGYRVMLIRPAEALHPAAANALLKTLEEPPPYTLIILVSNQPARLLATIRSRCRRLALHAPPPETALEWLRGQSIPEAAAVLSAAGGAPLLARDLAEPPEAELRKRLLTELARPGGADTLQFAAGIEKAGVERFVHWMQTWVHDLVRLRLAGDVRHHGEYAAALRSRAKDADLEALLALDRELAAARGLASHPLNARLVAEHLLMSYNRATMGMRP